MNSPRFASALSTRHDGTLAIREAADELSAGLDGRSPDLLLAFTTHHHSGEFDQFASRIGELTGARVLLGCTGEALVGSSREIEGEPALSLWGVAADDIELEPFHIEAQAGEEGPEFVGGPDFSETRRSDSSLILLGEPFSFPMPAYLEILDELAPGLPAVGGMASGGAGAGKNCLFLGGQLFTTGVVGVHLRGEIALHPVVSQVYRPVGEPFVVTACDGALVRKLGGKSAPSEMMRTLEALPEQDRALLQNGPFLGIAWDAVQSSFERTDFLAHPIRGVAPQEEAVVIVGHVRRGQTVQFMIRDVATAGDDLKSRLDERGGGPPEESHQVGALVFTCNGRGRRMFDESNHDISRVQQSLGGTIPAAGFFAMGEIGPVGRRNHLHGFTASIAVYRASPSDQYGD